MSSPIEQKRSGVGFIDLSSPPITPAPMSMQELGRLSEAEIDKRLRSQGVDPNSVEDRSRSISAKLRSEFSSKARVQKLEEGELVDGPAIETIRFFDERVAAGSPQWNGGGSSSRSLLPSDMFGKQNWENVFVTKVTGWSMTNDHITDGDVVLVDATAEPKDGDIVVAYLAGEGQVVKRLRLLGDKAILESAHPDYKPIVIEDPSELIIQGVVRGRAGKI